jgi:hypothetical protein
MTVPGKGESRSISPWRRLDLISDLEKLRDAIWTAPG